MIGALFISSQCPTSDERASRIVPFSAGRAGGGGGYLTGASVASCRRVPALGAARSWLAYMHVILPQSPAARALLQAHALLLVAPRGHESRRNPATPEGGPRACHSTKQPAVGWPSWRRPWSWGS